VLALSAPVDLTMPDQNEIAVVIPAYNAAHQLRKSLPQTRHCFPNVPVLVVDAGSTDETEAVARSLGARVLSLSARAGPAQARNAGARAVEAETILFLDADCVPHPDVPERVRAAFRTHPDLVALTGSYDAEPAETGFFSLYMNLRHHFTHQRARTEPATFWAGCGAVRREAFLRAGGFDAERYPRPQIEDIELGTRLRRFGRLRLDPELQVTHLKRWSLRSVVETDIWSRAIPWARLILETGELENDLNLRRSQRVAAALAPLVLLALPAGTWAAWTGRWSLLATCAAIIGVSLLLNGDMTRFFARARGPRFAAAAWLFHQIHLVYSAAAFVLSVAAWRMGAKRG